mgnify:CR=1 FL=1
MMVGEAGVAGEILDADGLGPAHRAHHHHAGDWPLPPLSLAAAQEQAAAALPGVAHVPAQIPRARAADAAA